MSKQSDEPFWYRNVKGVACGTGAGIAVTLVGHPFDTIKVRLQTQSSTNPTYNGMFDCIKKSLQWEGVSGFYKGVASPLTGQVFFRTSLFTTYYESQYYIKNKYERQQLRTEDYFIAGGVTGIVASFADGPIDLFKSKLQYQIIAEKNNIPLSVRYTGVLHCFTHTLKMHGLRGVYQGLGPTLVRDIPGYFSYFGCNEYLKKIVAKPGQSSSEIGLFKFMMCGGVSGLIFWHLVYNVDVIKSAMMADDIDPTRRRYKNMLDCARQLYTKEGGYPRFWRGYWPCMIRGFIANAMMLYVVDVTRKLFPAYK